jgi:hypothetical protein
MSISPERKITGFPVETDTAATYLTPFSSVRTGPVIGDEPFRCLFGS